MPQPYLEKCIKLNIYLGWSEFSLVTYIFLITQGQKRWIIFNPPTHVIHVAFTNILVILFTKCLCLRVAQHGDESVLSEGWGFQLQPCIFEFLTLVLSKVLNSFNFSFIVYKNGNSHNTCFMDLLGFHKIIPVGSLGQRWARISVWYM